MKNNRFGQSTVLSNYDYLKIRKHQSNLKHRLIIDIAWYTGERLGAIIQLKVDNVFESNGNVREFITFQSNTRKASPDGKRLTRQVPVHSSLKEILSAYCLSNISEWLFPGADPSQHISFRTCDYLLRNAVEKAGLGNKGISSHSFRRSLITNLNNKGVDLKTIQKVTGHQDVRSLVRYIDVTEDQVRGAIELI
ncbi:tyrosine-type recombinase/integrase [Plectonema cf. radiosum LEGE 06105]|uniref:Tyrosine-type recombinase/integrase n=1 Tax=Plectonema cf. radiosum LEGE 06105 TaxID=945769 RepID=A0A8J7F608_9CYAN|nr:tyrosine-type recombinase/integrase [Plectonema radiosum]MBE9214565.1 tyrosine-type recombinase/integrase [Plectonema cf. radiosum LEGE 06105]